MRRSRPRLIGQAPREKQKNAVEMMDFHDSEARRLAMINDLGPLSFRSVEINDKAGPLDRITARFVFARGAVVSEHGQYRIEQTSA